MKIYRNEDELRRLATLTPEAELGVLVRRVYASSRSTEYPDESASLLGVAVLEPQTLPDEAERQLGFPITKNRWTGLEPNEEGFAPWWEIIESFEHWYELIFVLSDDGAGMVVYVPKAGDGEITRLCAKYAKEGLAHDLLSTATTTAHDHLRVVLSFMGSPKPRKTTYLT